MFQPGDQIDVWVVDRPLGQGGMGSVYRCHNREAKRILAAVKVLDANLQRVPHAKARFVREAEILFGLDHPNIVKVRNVRMDLATPYLEMEFVDGESLEARIRQGPEAAAEALPLFRQVADALVYLHARGVRHRDVKPSNLLIQGGTVVKLVDFGIATEADAATITERGQTFGSVAYAPPEWLDPEHLDPVRWDIYSTGVVFYEMLTGCPAFPPLGEGTQRQWVVHVMATKQRHPPLDPGPKFPVKLRSLIRDMTRSDWRQRLDDARLVRDRLLEVDLDEVDPTLRFPEEDAPRASAPTWYPEPPAARGHTMVPDANTDEVRAPRLEGSVSSDVRSPPVVTAPKGTPDPGAPPPVANPARKAAIGLGVAGVLGVAAIGGAAAWFATRPPPPPATRDVQVVVSGLAADVPVAVTLAGHAPAKADGFAFAFPAVTPGAATLHAAVGKDCPATGEAPAWCAVSDTPVSVAAGDGVQLVAVTLAPPAPRPVAVVAPGVDRIAVTLGEQHATGEGGPARFEAVPPGRYTATVSAGTCTPEAAGCDARHDCPPGCTSWSGELVVPAGTGEHHAEVTVTPPAAPAKATAPRATGDGPSVAAGSGHAVTTDEFARWLAKHPEWQHDAAVDAGKAESAYLKGWDAATAPAGAGGRAVVNVSWAAAQAYCAGRGGLAALDAAPLTWTEGTAQPWHEYRRDGDRPAWRRSDGGTSTSVKPSDSAAMIGFRCAR